MIYQTYLSGVEGGKRNPTVVVLQRIAAALGLDITTIVSLVAIAVMGVGAFFLIRRRYNPDWLANIVFRLDQRRRFVNVANRAGYLCSDRVGCPCIFDCWDFFLTVSFSLRRLEP